METVLRGVMSARVRIRVEGWEIGPITTVLVGRDCERTSRNLGPDVFVAPLREIGQELWAWLGLREEWQEEGGGGGRRFSFRTIGLTVHFGFRHLGRKPQIFRAEWAGWSRWFGSEFGFQAAGAGHPHWQFDAVESLFQSVEAEHAASDLNELRSGTANGGTSIFVGQAPDTQEAVDVVRKRELSRIHFPSVAPWWRKAPHNEHAHAPTSGRDIQTWTEETLRYIVDELDRI